MKIPPIPEIPKEEQTPIVKVLLQIAHALDHKVKEQAAQIEMLKLEISRLKGQKGPPKIPPAKRGENAKGKAAKDAGGKGRSSQGPNLKKKRREERIINPEEIPEGSRFKGYQDFNVEEMAVEAVAIRFRMAVYVTPEGKTIRGKLPKEFKGCGHFGPTLRAFVLSQYHACGVTQPLLLSQLHEFGVEISAGELNNILIEDVEKFHEEKDSLLKAGLENSDYIHTDDTGARHNGENGVCTVVGSPLFTYFQSTSSKSRVNFLEVLRGTHTDYRLTAEALIYAFDRGLSEDAQEKLEAHEGQTYEDKKSWDKFLRRQGILSPHSVRTATEAALLGSAIFHGLPKDMRILSDAAPQFAVLYNALCWIHEERHYSKLIPSSETERAEIEEAKSLFWGLYQDVKKFQKEPTLAGQDCLRKRFDKIFSVRYESEALNALLKNTFSRKEGLLRVLSYPGIPLDNNGAERDIREYVKKRKISGGTRSEAGRRARDTFTSLKKTCVKLGRRFWDYALDRLTGAEAIPPLACLIAQKARERPGPSSG